MTKTRLLLTALLLCTLNLIAQTKADDIIGIWLTNGKDPAKIQIYRSGGGYDGKIIWLKFPEANGKPKVDKNNPDEKSRNQPIIGLLILKGFRFDGHDTWEDGRIYDPESGKTYSCYLTFKDRNTLKVRGFVGVSLFGRTEYWNRSY
jgi:uncharacterized protein (DUF2147 family)